ncbi:MAG: thiamine pyrophosphate-binding protein [Dehalococcoidia bacterium]|nr:thiamine pyrophosphate-binding protein [Dehalococcoidia bacterium]
MATVTGAQALVRQLIAEGVDTIFALPGVQIMAAFDAFHEYQDDIRLVHVRHEQATTYMADGYAKATGKVGVAMAVPGPGAINAGSGLGTAYATSTPVLLISGQIDSQSLGRREGQLHEVEDQLDVFRPLTKWVHRVTRVEDVPGAVHEAFKQLRTGRPRPVELEIPPDTLAATGEAETIPAEEYPPQAAGVDEIAQAADILASAERPAILVGGGARISGAGDEALQIADFLQAPLMGTQDSKGVVPESSPFYVGTNYASVGPADVVFPDSDVLLAIGTRLLFRELPDGDMPRIIHIDIDPDEIGRNLPTELGIVADAKTASAQLLDQLRETSQPRPSDADRIAGYRSDFASRMRALVPPQAQIIEDMRAALPDDAIVVSGVTNIGYWSNVFFEVREPQTYITSGYFGTLGYAFPTALGAQVGRPDRKVIALCGDGGFMYSPQELSSAMRHGINAVAVVFNNNAFGASEWDQTHRYGGNFIGTDLHNPDFVQLAQSFGAVGMSTDPEGFGEMLEVALNADAPVLLEVVIPNMMPPFQIVE